MDQADNPFGRVTDHWEQVVEDMAATAEEYRNAGWETVELHPGDVTTLTPASRNPEFVRPEEGADIDVETPEGPEEYGLDVLVPGEEFDRLRALVDDHDFDSYEVLRAEAGGVVFALVVLESSDREVAVFVPTYYEVSALTDLRAAVDEQGALHTRVRQLSGDEVVTFFHDDPEPFFPESDDEADEDDDGH